jgi:hypothetical protein
MITLDLSQRSVTIEELFNCATSDSVLVLAKNGREFLVEEADTMDKEAATLGKSRTFAQFLEGRSSESGGVRIEDIERGLSL